ncbi:MAG TPA: hypothetical protein VFU76_06615, partial [Terriglobales bacterium]|nr:hypothetical protein [Terriglobales bacterium]
MMRASLWLRVLAILLIVGCGCAVLAQEDESENGKPEAKAKELPLKATDKVEFNTDEGTWMSLDMSPDGKTIVFDLLGDIYTIPASGGAATRIIGGISFESQPKFSPDGKSLAFLSDRGGAEALWLANADGSNPHPLTKDRNQGFLSPSWTPDGKWILVSRHDPSAREYSLWMYDKDGGTGIRLGGPAPHQPEEEEDETGPRRRGPNRYGPVASPDGKFIYFAQRTGLFSYNVQFPLWQIHRFDRRTSEVSTLTEAQGSAMRPILSPDGKFLVYATRYETGTALKVRDLETGEERWLLHPVTRDDQESVASRDLMPGYTFTPDGKNILMTLNGKIALVDFQSGKPSFIPFTANVQAEIAPRLHFEYKVDDSPTLKARLIRWPALSPDGKRVAFSALNKLWIMDLPDGKPHRVTQSSEGEFMPAWSPDGKSIAYVTWSAAGGNIQRVSAEGGEPQTLTRRSAYYSEPAFSPDGRKIVFITGRRDEQLYADLHMLEQHTEEADVPDDAMLERAA